MPSEKSIRDYKRFMETGVCDCGHHLSEHATNTEAVKDVAINCKLTHETIQAWHTPRMEPVSG